MLDTPGITLRVEEAGEWSGERPLADRALACARRLLGHAQGPPRRLVVEEAPREHVGLGVGTQLGLAVARGVSASWGLEVPAPTLAGWVGRGLRSSLGVHGFERGGFLGEAGKVGDELSPLVARADFPSAWRVLFVLPEGVEGCHGPEERAAFERLSAPLATCEALCRLVLLGMLPALAAADLPAFGEAVHD